MKSKHSVDIVSIQMTDYAQHWHEYLDATKREDEMAATMALGALIRMDAGDTNRTKHLLETTISTYYRGHRTDGNSNVLNHIETFAATNASLSNSIHRPLE